MFRILVATFALLILAGAAALHAQVPYTTQEWWVPAPAAPAPPSIPSIPQFQPQPSQQQWQPFQQQWNFPQETQWDRIRRQDQERMDRYSDQVRQQFQAEAQERATRCARRGSRKIYADCMDW